MKDLKHYIISVKNNYLLHSMFQKNRQTFENFVLSRIKRKSIKSKYQQACYPNFNHLNC